MSITIKSPKEIEIMKQGGHILNGIVEEIASTVKEGISTKELDQKAFDLCKKNNVKPAFFGYDGYPATLCLGVNDTVVHGIPSKEEVLRTGDLLSIDMGIIYNNFYSDKAVTIGLEGISENAKRLIEVTREALFKGISQAIPGNTIGDIGNAIEETAKKAQFSVVIQMVGHGIGKHLHEEPQIPGYGSKGKGTGLKEGMTLAIEAIVNEGSGYIRFMDDRWTTKTEDGKLSALFEHTILVKGKRAEILTA